MKTKLVILGISLFLSLALLCLPAECQAADASLPHSSMAAIASSLEETSVITDSYLGTVAITTPMKLGAQDLAIRHPRPSRDGDIDGTNCSWAQCQRVTHHDVPAWRVGAAGWDRLDRGVHGQAKAELDLG